MNRVAMLGLLNGILACGCAVASLLFSANYRATRDRLFLLFGIAFGILSLERLLTPLDIVGADHRVWLYGLRLIAFVVIIVAIIDKNRASPGAH